jgi:glyoxylase I family protein
VITARFSHVALSVSDLERARAFYCECFGFVAGDPYHGEGRRVSTLMAVANASFDGVFLKLDGLLLELLAYRSAPAPARGPLRVPDHLGLAHLSLLVDDLEAIGQRIEELGGAGLARMTHAFGGDEPVAIAFFLDPEGNRIELIEHPSDAAAATHAAFIGVRRLGWPRRSGPVEVVRRGPEGPGQA